MTATILEQIASALPETTETLRHGIARDVLARLREVGRDPETLHEQNRALIAENVAVLERETIHEALVEALLGEKAELTDERDDLLVELVAWRSVGRVLHQALDAGPSADIGIVRIALAAADAGKLAEH